MHCTRTENYHKRYYKRHPEACSKDFGMSPPRLVAAFLKNPLLLHKDICKEEKRSDAEIVETSNITKVKEFSYRTSLSC